MPIIPHGTGDGKAEELRLPEAGGSLFSRLPDGALTVAVVLLASSASFALGYITGKEGREEPIRIEERTLEAALPAAVGAAPLTAKETVPKTPKAKKAEPTGTATAETGVYVASKKGTKYHLPTCPGAKQMSEANKIWFTTKEEVEAAGFTPAANCKGL